MEGAPTGQSSRRLQVEVGASAPRLPDTEIFHAMPSDSSTVLVSFGAKGGGHGHFHFFKLLQPLPNLTKLLVRDPAGRWYNDGLPGIGDTLEEITKAIERELEKLGATRVITAGPSMGGYAAILFGCMLGAERALPVSPQTLLDLGLRHAPPADVSLQAADLAPIIRASPQTKIDLVAGWDDHLDIFNAQRVARLPSVRVLALRHGTHSLVEDLHRDDKLMPLLNDLIAGRTPAECDINPSLDPEVVERIADTAYAFHAEDWQRAAERIAPVAERSPNWAGPNFDLGRALASSGDWAGAELPLARAVSANPRWADANLWLGRCLLHLDRDGEGRDAVMQAAELNPALDDAVQRLLRQ